MTVAVNETGRGAERPANKLWLWKGIPVPAFLHPSQSAAATVIANERTRLTLF
jgi:hypothetical protein